MSSTSPQEISLQLPNVDPPSYSGLTQEPLLKENDDQPHLSTPQLPNSGLQYTPPVNFQPGYAPGQVVFDQGVLAPPMVAPRSGYPQPNLFQPTSEQIVLPRYLYRDRPVNTVCPHCKKNIITRTKLDSGCLAWLLCFLICCFGCSWGCCLIPFCVDSCLDVIHYCPNCRVTIYVFKRM